MPWTDEDYQRALKAQAENPHPEFAAAIADYERVHKLGAAEERGAEEGFISQQFPTHGEPLPQGIQHTPRTAGETMFRGSPKQDLQGMELALELRKNDPALPSASKRKDIYAPPEYMATPDPASPLSSLRGYLPAWAGGGTEVWHEPVPEEAAKALGVKRLTEDSPEYKEYADKVWAERYARAQANNENVVRARYAKSTTGGDMFSAVALKAPEAVDAAFLGASDMAAPGALTELRPWLDEKTGAVPIGERSRVHQLMDENSIATGLGGIAGVMAPTGMAGLLTKLNTGALPLVGRGAMGLAKEMERGVPSIAKAAMKGALGGGVTAAELQGMHDISSTLGTGQAPEGDETDRLLSAMLGGGLFGAAAGAGGAYSKGLRSTGTERGRQLRIADAALGEPATSLNPLNPIKMSPEVDAAIAEGGIEGGDFYGEKPHDILASRLAPKIVARATAEDAALEASIVAKNQAYYEKPVALVQKPIQSIEKGLRDVIFLRTKEARSFPMEPGPKASVDEAGVKSVAASPAAKAKEASSPSSSGSVDTIPDPGNVTMTPGGKPREALLGADVNQYKDLYRQAVDVIPTWGSDAQRTALREGGEIMQARLARDLGADVPFDVPDSAKVVVVAKRMNAKQYDEMVYAIDNLADAASRKGPGDRVLGYLQKAIREDRGQFPGLNELHAESKEQIASLQSRMKLAGIPQGENVPEADKLVGAKTMAQGFRAGGRSDNDAALMSLLENPGPLYQIAAAHGLESLGNPGLGRTGLVGRAALMADVPARAAAKYGLPAAAALGGPAGTKATETMTTTKKVGKNLGRKTKRFLVGEDQ